MNTCPCTKHFPPTGQVPPLAASILGFKNPLEEPAVAPDYNTHLTCLRVEWDPVRSTRRPLNLPVRDMVQQGRRGEGSRCNSVPQKAQMGKAPELHRAEG